MNEGDEVNDEPGVDEVDEIHVHALHSHFIFWSLVSLLQGVGSRWEVGTTHAVEAAEEASDGLSKELYDELELSDSTLFSLLNVGFAKGAPSTWSFLSPAWRKS